MRSRPRPGSRERRALPHFQAASMRAARTRRARAPPSQHLGYAELGEVFSPDLRGIPRRDLHKHLPQLGEWNLRKR